MMVAQGSFAVDRGTLPQSTKAGPVALVLFHGRADRWWLRLLKPGFRHCLVALRQEDLWLLMDPRLDRTELRVFRWRGNADPVVWFAEKGFLAVPVRPRSPVAGIAPPGVMTCVENVKRVLGLRSIWVQTPWQLFRKIT